MLAFFSILFKRISFLIQVDMLKVNGEPVDNNNLTVQVFSGNALLQEIRNVTTDSKGRANAFLILQGSGDISLKVKEENTTWSVVIS